MPLKILVPLVDLQKALGDELILDAPPRCSRCGAVPAEYFETHNLKLRIGPKKPGLYRQSYQVSKGYRLKLRVCETCYRADFVTTPEQFEKDATPLGKLARAYSRLFTIGAVIACVGLLLMTSLVPGSSSLGQIKSDWPYVTGPGMIIVLATWLHQRSRQSRIRASLTDAGINLADRPRAEIRTPVLENERDAHAIPLEISLKDEGWAAECAAIHHWDTENFTKFTKQGEEENESQFR